MPVTLEVAAFVFALAALGMAIVALFWNRTPGPVGPTGMMGAQGDPGPRGPVGATGVCGPGKCSQPDVSVQNPAPVGFIRVIDGNGTTVQQTTPRGGW